MRDRYMKIGRESERDRQRDRFGRYRKREREITKRRERK